MTMPTATIAAEIPYAEMTLDSIDPSGWLSSMDMVCDGDKSVVYVICTLPQKPSLAETVPARYRFWSASSADMANHSDKTLVKSFPNGNVRLGNLVISKTEYAQAQLDWIDAVMKVWGWKT